MSIMEDVEKKYMKKDAPQVGVGDTVKVYAKIVEGGKERIQAFEGIVIKKQGGGMAANFTVRKVVDGVGVERTFPFHSPKLESVKITKKGSVRRAKLYYLRGRIGTKASKIKEGTEAGVSK